MLGGELVKIFPEGIELPLLVLLAQPVALELLEQIGPQVQHAPTISWVTPWKRLIWIFL